MTLRKQIQLLEVKDSQLLKMTNFCRFQLDLTALRSVEESPIHSPKSTSDHDYPASQQPRNGAWGAEDDEENRGADEEGGPDGGPHGLPPLPFTTSGAIRRESTLPMVNNAQHMQFYISKYFFGFANMKFHEGNHMVKYSHVLQ